MTEPLGKYYYAKQPTEAAPVTAVVGPFPTHNAARDHLKEDVKTSEDDFHTGEWGAYQILQCVGLVLPQVTHTVKLKEL